MRIKIYLIIIMISIILSGCTNKEEPTATPVLTYSRHTVTPSTPIPVYKRPEEPITVDTRLSLIKYQPIKGIDLHFSRELSCSDNVMIYSSDVNGEKLYGYMDMEFNILSEPISKTPGYFVNGLARITDSDGVRIIDKNFNVLDVNPELPFLYNGQWAEVCILSNGEPQAAGYDEDNNPIHIIDEDYYGLDFDEFSEVDPETLLVPCYLPVSDQVGTKRTWGYKYLVDVQDPDSRFVISPIYSEASKFSEGLAAVREGDKWGYINEQGEVVIDFKYDHVTDFNSGIACAAVYDSAQETNVRQPNYWGLINNKGDVLIDFRQSYCGGISNGIAFFETHNDGDFFYNSKGEDIVGQFIQARPGFEDEMVIVRLESGFNIINLKGEFMLEENYARIDYLNDGLASVEVNRKTGVINMNEEFVIIPEYRYIYEFDHGYALASNRYDGSLILDLAGNEWFGNLNINSVSKFNGDGYMLAYKGSRYKTYYMIHIDDGE